MKRWLVGVVLVAGSCGPTNTTDPYAVVKTEWDDVGAALKCRADDDSQNCLEPRENTIRVDDELRLGFEKADFDETTRTLTLQLRSGATLDPRLKEGAFLYRGRRDRKPLLHRIESMQTDGARVRLVLAQARPRDAFVKGRLRARIPIAKRASTMQPLEGTSRQPLEFAIGPADCSGNVFNKTLASPLATGSVSLELTKCKFQLEASIDAVLEWDTGVANVDRLELSVTGGVDAALTAALTLDLTARYGEGRRIWEGPELPVTIAGILITINPSLFAGYDLSAKAQLTVTQGFTLTDSVTAGFGYSDRLGWYSIDERSSVFKQVGPTLSIAGNVTATAWVEPRLDIKAFGFVGGSVALRGFAEGKITTSTTGSGGTATGTACASLDLGLTPKVGAVAELVGVQLFSEFVELPTIRTTLVANACEPYAGPRPTDCAPSSGCCTDGECPRPSDPDVTVKCERGTSTTGGKFRYSCVESYPAAYCLTGSSTAATVCDDHNQLTADSCVDNRCQNTLPNADAAFSSSNTAATLPPSCFTAGCCFTDADCADGLLTTRNDCFKPVGAGPDVKGTCVVL